MIKPGYGQHRRLSKVNSLHAKLYRMRSLDKDAVDLGVLRACIVMRFEKSIGYVNGIGMKFINMFFHYYLSILFEFHLKFVTLLMVSCIFAKIFCLCFSYGFLFQMLFAFSFFETCQVFSYC